MRIKISISAASTKSSMARVRAGRRRIVPLGSKENFPLERDWEEAPSPISTRRPLLPRSKPSTQPRSKIMAMKDRWEHSQFESDSRGREPESHLKENLSGYCSGGEGRGSAAVTTGTVYAAQRELVRKHYEAKSKIGSIGGIGGGVSIWPAMDDMRLSQADAIKMALICATLVVATVATFYCFHGTHILQLKYYTSRLAAFHALHPLEVGSGDLLFSQQLVAWHRDFLDLQDSIHREFDMVWSQRSIFELSFIVLYIVGIVTLLYFLADNMFSKNRLTPRRIKIWISLLVVVMTWTLLSVYLLIRAQALETTTQDAVHSLSSELAGLVQTDLNLTQYQNVLLYWRTRCLPPTSRGVLSLMGLLQVQDVAYYLQYYSLPVLTAICTPIVKIVLSLRTVYKNH